MSESVVTVTETFRWDDSKCIHLVGTLAIAAGDYTSNGIACNLLSSVLVDTRPGFIPLPGINAQPIYTAVKGISGYTYEYVGSTKKLIIRSVPAMTPAGTVAAPTFTGTLGTAPTFTVTKGAIVASTELGLSADSTAATVNNNAIATTRILAAVNSPVGATTPAGTNSAPAFTGTAIVAAVLAQLAATATPAGVVADVISLYAIFKKNV